MKQIDYFRTNLDLPSLLRILGCHQLQTRPSVQEDREVPACHLHLKEKHESTSTKLMHMQNETLYLQWQVNTLREIYKILLNTNQADHQRHVLLQALGAQILLFHQVCLADLCKKHKNKNLHGNPASLVNKVKQMTESRLNSHLYALRFLCPPLFPPVLVYQACPQSLSDPCLQAILGNLVDLSHPFKV